MTPSRHAIPLLVLVLPLAAACSSGGGTEVVQVAPTITVTGVADGGSYPGPVTIGISVDRGSYSATLDGASFASGGVVSAPDAHVLAVAARNGSATSSRTVRFTITGSGGAVDRVVVAPEIGTLTPGTVLPFAATALDGSGQAVAAGLSWSSTDPGVASVAGAGVVHAVAQGEALIVVTAPGGAADTAAVHVTPLATSSVYRSHLEFGLPTDGTPSDEVVLYRPEYALSYSPARGGANWVSWDVNRTHFGSVPRCDCFSADTQLPAGVYRVVSSDYTGSGYTRGHMVMSEQRTQTSAENAATFLMSNVLPQTQDLNTGPWLDFEIYTSDLARISGKEVYNLAGGIWPASPATLNGQGKVAVPTSTWKIVVVMDYGRGLADVTSASDLQVIAVNMPNTAGIQGQPWTAYRTTVDAIEAATGYDFLSALPDSVEEVVEARQ